MSGALLCAVGSRRAGWPRALVDRVAAAVSVTVWRRGRVMIMRDNPCVGR